MITVRLEYGGMRVENTVPDAQAEAKLADMYARHGITPLRRDRMRGRANLTGAYAVARFIDAETGQEVI